MTVEEAHFTYSTKPATCNLDHFMHFVKTKAENLLIKYYTNTDYTIVRPGGLITSPPTGKAMLTEDKMASGAIHRSDVAKLVVDALYSKKLTKKIVTAIDPSLAEAPPAYAAAEV